MFEIVTTKDKLLKIPKENSLFRVMAKFEAGRPDLEWRIWGDQFVSRSGERAGRKFNGRSIRGKGAPGIVGMIPIVEGNVCDAWDILQWKTWLHSISRYWKR